MTAIVRSGILTTIRRFVRARSGVSAVEFAVVLPVMLTLYLGGVDVTQGIVIKRKTTIATRTIGDLVARDTSISDAEIARIFAATSAVLAPYPTTPLQIVVSSIAIDKNGRAKVVWSDAFQTSPRATNSTVTLPSGLNVPDTTLIWAETQYQYTPTIGYIITGAITLKDQLYLRPRLTNSIDRVS